MYNLIKFIKISGTSCPHPLPLWCNNKTVNCQNCQIAMLALQAGLSINAYIKDALEEKVESAVAI